MTDRTLIRRGHVLSMDPAVGDFPDGDVLIEDGRIAAVAQHLDADAEIIEAAGCVVLPGLIDGHRHLWQTFLRGSMANCTLPTYMRDMLGRVAKHMQPDDSYTGTQLGALECLDAGITTVLDWSHALNTPDDSDARISALRDSGIRAIFAPNTPAAPQWYSWTEPRGHPEIRRLLAEQFTSNTDRVRLAAGLRSPGQVPDSVVVGDWALARELDLLISIHAGTRGPNGHEAAALQRLGLLAADVHFAHGNAFTDDELALVAAAGCGITISPYAEMTAGLGRVRPLRMLAHGIAVGLSVDATAIAPGDLFSEMRVAFACARQEELPEDTTAPYEPTVQIMDILRMATIEGARAIGLQDVCGSLTVGKAADIVLIRGDQVGTGPIVDPVATVVVSADAGSVDTVLVGGKLVKRHGVLVGVDVPAVLARADSSRERVLTQAGWAERPSL